MTTYPVIVISGTSGSGKSTLARYLSKYYVATYIEGDNYFKRIKPHIDLTLDNGEQVRADNYDSIEAIDWESLSRDVVSAAREMPVILATFAPVISKYSFPVTLHIRLTHATQLHEEAKYSIQARQVTKRLNTTDKIRKDTAMVRQAVIPFQEEIRRDERNTPNVVTSAYLADGQRKSIEELRVELAPWLEKYIYKRVTVEYHNDRLDWQISSDVWCVGCW